MSITLKIASATNVVVTKAREIVNGFAFQKVGTSYKDATILNATQNVGKTGTAKTRWAVKRPFTYVGSDGLTKTELVHVTVEVTIPEVTPFVTVDEVPYLVQSIGAEPQFLAHVRDRIQPA